MATLSVLGKTLVNPEELAFKQYSTMPAPAAAARETVPAPLTFSNASISLAEINQEQEQRKFQPIGIGKPLSVEIVTVYAGSYQSFWGGKKDLAVVSGVKNSATFDAASRAINRIAPKTPESRYLEFEALAEGTPIVYYSPAMDADSMVVSFEMMFDNFDTTVMEAISRLLGSGAGIPVFLPAAAYLVGAAQLIKLAAGLGNSLFAGSPNLKGSVFVNFNSPVLPPTVAREFVIFNDYDAAEFGGLESKVIDQGGNKKIRLVHSRTGEVYAGPAPYLIVTLDGATRNLPSFTPKIASAAMLKKFYGEGDTTAEVTTALEEAMQLHNDFSYAAKGDRLKQQLTTLQPGTPEHTNLKTLYDAYAKNIQNPKLQLPAIP